MQNNFQNKTYASKVVLVFIHNPELFVALDSNYYYNDYYFIIIEQEGSTVYQLGIMQHIRLD